LKKKILIVGVGNIGFRHFQSVNDLNNVEITLVDPRVQIIKKLYIKDEIKKKNKYLFYNTVNKIFYKKFDLVIIATNSKIRFKIFNDLVKNDISKNIILEKVVYSNINEYDKYINIINGMKINCWVNCLNRVFPISKKIKSKSKNFKLKKITVVGKNWGLFCNFIHFLDLASYLADSRKIKNVKINIEGVAKSKRRGFSEYFGKLNLNFDQGSSLMLISRKGETDYTINIDYFKKSYHINEIKNSIKIISKNRILNKKKVIMPKVSDLTKIFVKKILSNKSPGLVKLKDCLDLHQPVISSLCENLSEKYKKKIYDCKIT
tara:strand:+ start:283 stop:1239 length:957 start_codon:yes stop_codon:yes gene_type:complete